MPQALPASAGASALRPAAGAAFLAPGRPAPRAALRPVPRHQLSGRGTSEDAAVLTFWHQTAAPPRYAPAPLTGAGAAVGASAAAAGASAFSSTFSCRCSRAAYAGFRSSLASAASGKRRGGGAGSV